MTPEAVGVPAASSSVKLERPAVSASKSISSALAVGVVGTVGASGTPLKVH